MRCVGLQHLCKQIIEWQSDTRALGVVAAEKDDLSHYAIRPGSVVDRQVAGRVARTWGEPLVLLGAMQLAGRLLLPRRRASHAPAVESDAGARAVQALCLG